MKPINALIFGVSAAICTGIIVTGSLLPLLALTVFPVMELSDE